MTGHHTTRHDRPHPPLDPPDNSAKGAVEGAAWVTYNEEHVRPFVITGGRTRPEHQMRLVSLLTVRDAERAATLGPEANPEARHAIQLCRRQPCSVAEIAARTGLPAHATKIVLSDLITAGVLVLAMPAPHVPDPIQLLEGLRSGLKTRLSDVA